MDAHVDYFIKFRRTNSYGKYKLVDAPNFTHLYYGPLFFKTLLPIFLFFLLIFKQVQCNIKMYLMTSQCFNVNLMKVTISQKKSKKVQIFLP